MSKKVGREEPETDQMIMRKKLEELKKGRDVINKRFVELKQLRNDKSK